MNLSRVRVRRERPTTLALAVALCVTMLVVYVLTLNLKAPDVVESMAAAPRVTRQIVFGPVEGWCVCMARCENQQEARLRASAWVNRGAAGYVTRLEDDWLVLGAVYDGEREAERIAKRLSGDEDIPAEVLPLRAEGLTLRITAPEAQIEAIAGADAALRTQTRQLGEIALQLDRGEIGADAARTLCALAATEASEASSTLAAIPGAKDNGLCAALIGRLDALAGMLDTVAGSGRAGTAALSGMLRCAQVDNFVGQWELLRGF